ncbi:B12-binding domain-containing radical SAM protein [Actinomadura rubrobrunea]|uniref:B12-binding domain-containing radical SAM protein n=1 Tax=Actinomadura rubrobrunea TaxID=115335 RepID=UPI0014713906|nr:radical SAM protein [Actinomadura rubrobrunea]
MDLVLVNSPIHDYSRYPRYESSYSTPVGLLYVATSARNAGFDASILDAEHRQLAPAEIAAEINSMSPRVAGFNTFSINFAIVERITELIDPHIRIVIGGPHVSNMPAGHFGARLRRAQIMVRGDGESTIVDILRERHPSTIPGIYFRDALGMTVATAPAADISLDELPIPDRTMLPTEPYWRDGRRWMDISISRGCVFTCKFCAGSCRSNGTTYRRRSAESVVAEIHHLISNHQVQGIQIVDDLPFNGRAQLLDFLDLLEKERISLSWELNFPLQFLRKLSAVDIARMKALGVSRVSFGIESGSLQTRRVMGKFAKEEELFQVVRTLAECEISAKGYFVIGFPGESQLDMELTIDLARRLHAVGGSFFRPRIFMFKPMPGSALWQSLLAAGHSMDELLDYADFELERTYYNKHAWGTNRKYALVPPNVIQEMINDFYTSIGEQD